MVTGDQDGLIVLWDIPRYEWIRKFESKEWVLSLSFSPDGTQVASGHGTKNARIFDSTFPDRHQPRVIEMFREPVFAVQFCNGGRHLALGGRGVFRVIDLQKGEKDNEVVHLLESRVGFHVLASSRDGRYLGTLGGKSSMRITAGLIPFFPGLSSPKGDESLFSIREPKKEYGVIGLLDHDFLVFSADFSPDASRIATVTHVTDKLTIWNWRDDIKVINLAMMISCVVFAR